MEIAVVGAVVGTTFRVLLDGLLEKPSEEIKRVWGFKTELNKLKSSLEMIRAFVFDVKETQLQTSAVELWLEHLEDVAFEADAVMDELNYELLRQKVENPNQVLNKVTCCFSSNSSYNIPFRRKMAHKIDDVNKSLERINKEAKGFGLQPVVANASCSSNVGPVIAMEHQTHSAFLEPNFVGREQDVSKFVEMLVDAPLENKVSVIPVVGMGGIGKTTLVRQVFHQEKTQSHFEQKVWVCVSSHFSAVTIFKMILERTSGENVQQLVNVETLLENVRVHFASKKYLLVLDDVWNEDSGKWEEFIVSLSSISSAPGNCIVVTTRNSGVASLVHTRPMYQLGSLSDDFCWSIVKSKALQGAVYQMEFDELAKSIARKCHGLPLAAKVIGGMLNGKPKDEWSFIIENHLSHVGQDENTILRILKSSYDHLPSSTLKKCFAYCSIFRQDFWIQREELIELWMAEGFLRDDKKLDMEAVGNICFNFLLSSSLLEAVTRDDYENVSICKMHDLVHDLACSVESGSYSKRDGGSNHMKKVRYLSLDSVTDGSLAISQEQEKYLRTLFLRDPVAHDAFLGSKHLHVLNIMGKGVQELPSAIGKLIHLRYLDISESQIKFLPAAICRLYNLQTLRSVPRFTLKTYLEELPNKIVGLTSLRHLHIPCMKLPPWIGKLTCLRTLCYYIISSGKGCGIGELENLKKLKGKLEIRNLEIVKDKEEAQHANLFGKPEIIKLVLRWGEAREGERNDQDVLEGLLPNPNLKSLEIIGYEGRNFPLWMITQNGIQGRREALNGLVTLKLQNCKHCEEIPMLGHLPSLKCLELRNMLNVRYIGLSFYGVENGNRSNTDRDVNFHITPFPVLKEITLYNMPNLIDWMDVGGAFTAFPCLEKVKIESCPQLKSIPSCSCLKIFDVHKVDTNFSLIDVCRKTSSLQVLRISYLPGLVSLPDDLFMKNQRMSELSVSSCPNLMRLVLSFNGGGAFLDKLKIDDCHMLKQLPHGIENLQLLETLQILGCLKLQSIPYANDESLGLTSLQHLEICGCIELTTFPYDLLKSCTSSLVYLCLSNLNNISTVVPSPLRMTSLRYLHIYRIPGLMNFPIEMHSLKRLKILSLGGFSESLDLDSFNDFLHCISHECEGYLENLNLYGQENWDSLPDQLQNFTALIELWLEEFRTEALPEWLGNLSSVKRLCLINCQKLKHMPPKDAMQRLTNLEHIDIGDCPLIEDRCSQEHTTANNDSELHKISHVKEVRFDWYRLSYGKYR